MNKKIAVIFFHKNIYKLYNLYWIDKCIESILNQKNVVFDIFEINYGNENISIFKNKKINFKHFFFYKEYCSHTEAMLFLLNKCFDEYHYDYVFNTNLDDYYHLNRFELQIKDMEENNTYLSSSLSILIEEKDNKDIIFDKTVYINTIVKTGSAFGLKKIKFEEGAIQMYDSNGNLPGYREIKNDKDFFYIDIFDFFGWTNNNLDLDFYENDLNFASKQKIKYEDIKKKIFEKHNIINHPCICFSKKFWNFKDKYGNFLRYRNDLPFEDLSLWSRACSNDIPISIVNKHLLFYRIHNNQIGEKKKKDPFKLFSKGPDLNENRLGILSIINEKNNIINLFDKIFLINKKSKIENIPIFNFIYIKYINSDYINSIENFLIKNDILKVKILTENISITDEYEIENNFEINNIIKKFDLSIIMNSDILYNVNDVTIQNLENRKEIYDNNLYNYFHHSMIL